MWFQHSRLFSTCFAVLLGAALAFAASAPKLPQPRADKTKPGMFASQPVSTSAQRLEGVHNIEGSWRRCTNVEIVGPVCVEAYAVPTNLVCRGCRKRYLQTVGLRLTVRGITMYDRRFDGHRECADEREILRLIEHDPRLLPFKPIIDKIIKDWSIVPAHLFLVCATINDLHYTKHNVTGCVMLERKILCYKEKCYAQGTKDMGCFDIPVKWPRPSPG